MFRYSVRRIKNIGRENFGEWPAIRQNFPKYGNIPLNVKLSILDEVCLGLRYLHSRNPPIVHRDLTPNNILATGGHLEAKITDLGAAKVVRSDNQKTMHIKKSRYIYNTLYD